MKTVMCFGTFDIVHLGHLNYFQQAKHHGDYLIVVVARDKTKQQQQKPILFNEQERLTLLKQLKVIDEVVLGYPHNHYRIIQEKKPDILCLGYDHQISAKDLQHHLAQLGLHPKIIRLKPYKPKKHKSTHLKTKILHSS